MLFGNGQSSSAAGKKADALWNSRFSHINLNLFFLLEGARHESNVIQPGHEFCEIFPCWDFDLCCVYFHPENS